jgi:hypothetical protein
MKNINDSRDGFLDIMFAGLLTGNVNGGRDRSRGSGGPNGTFDACGNAVSTDRGQCLLDSDDDCDD